MRANEKQPTENTEKTEGAKRSVRKLRAKADPRKNGGGIWEEGSVSPQKIFEKSILKPFILVHV